jgi:hypothetical protein
MTIKLPEHSFGDRVLRTLGKKRGVIIPKEPYEKHGPYAHAMARKESYWKALFRPKGAPLPEGVVDLDEVIETSQEQRRREEI